MAVITVIVIVAVILRLRVELPLAFPSIMKTLQTPWFMLISYIHLSSTDT